jgi:hypothetical protein
MDMQIGLPHLFLKGVTSVAFLSVNDVGRMGWLILVVYGANLDPVCSSANILLASEKLAL